MPLRTLARLVLVPLCLVGTLAAGGQAPAAPAAPPAAEAPPPLPEPGMAPAAMVPEEAVLFHQVDDLVGMGELFLERFEKAAANGDQMGNRLRRMLGAEEEEDGLGALLERFGVHPHAPVGFGILYMLDGRLIDPAGAGGWFVILPLASDQMFEALLRGPLRFGPRLAERRCRMSRRLLSRSARFDEVVRGVTPLQDLLAAPGYGQLQCPCGGTWTWHEEAGDIRCSVHREKYRDGGFGKLLQEGLPRETIGSFTLIGSEEHGVGYGLGNGLCVLSPDIGVVRAVLETAAGKRAAAAWSAAGAEAPAGRLSEGFLQTAPLTPLAEGVFQRSERALEGRPGSLERLLTILRTQPLATYDARQEGAVLTSTLRWPLGESAWARRLAAVEPTALPLGDALPPEAPLLVAGNILPELLEPLCLLAAVYGPKEAIAAEVAPLLTSRAFALAVTTAEGGGALEGQLGVPHLQALLSHTSEEAARTLALVPDLLTHFGHCFAEEREDWTVFQRYRSPADPELGTVAALHRIPGATATGFATAAAGARALRDRLETQAPGGGFADLAALAELGPVRETAHLRLYLHMPRLGEEIRLAWGWRVARREQQACLRHQAEVATLLEAYRAAAEEAGREEGADVPTLQDWFREQSAAGAVEDALDPVCPGTGQDYLLMDQGVECPTHGPRHAPRPVEAQPPSLPLPLRNMMALGGESYIEVWIEDGTLVMRNRQRAAAGPERRDADASPEVF